MVINRCAPEARTPTHAPSIDHVDSLSRTAIVSLPLLLR